MDDRLATIDIGQKVEEGGGAAVPLSVGIWVLIKHNAPYQVAS